MAAEPEPELNDEDELPDDVADAWAAVLIDVHEKRASQRDEQIDATP